MDIQHLQKNHNKNEQEKELNEVYIKKIIQPSKQFKQGYTIGRILNIDNNTIQYKSAN